MGLFDLQGIPLVAALLAAAPSTQPSVTFTQVNGSGDGIGRSYPAVCGATECRMELPVTFSEATCTVLASASLSEYYPIVTFSFTLKTCTRNSSNGSQYALDRINPRLAKLDSNRASSKIVSLHFGSALNDLVMRPEELSFVRVDTIFPTRAQR